MASIKNPYVVQLELKVHSSICTISTIWTSALFAVVADTASTAAH